jgi:tetratricopeptide (TPR) repeat protein
MELGPLEVRRVGVSLPNLKFPVDLSGGVRLFRHRRGQLEHLSLSVRTDVLGRWLDRRLRDVLGGLTRPVSVWRVPDGLGIGLSGARGTLAFDVLWTPDLGDARLVIARARGVDVDGPALAPALHAVDTVIGRTMERRGRIVRLSDAGAAIARAVMPAVGARAPRANDVRCSNLQAEGDEVSIVMDASIPPAASSREVVRALELAELTKDADDALARGDLESARASYVAALEQAPRHPEICRAVAELDLCSGGRAEGALSFLTEALPATETGVVGAALLARVGDLDAARLALASETRREEFAPLGALLWKRQAEYEDSGPARVAALDEAVARCPSLAPVRWARFAARLERGDVAGAIADAEHLEAAEKGNRARHAACREAADRMLAAGYVRDAGRLYERALRYVPDDAAATAGLGRALVETGRTARALALLTRAAALGEAAGAPQWDAIVDLAKLLAKMGDLPQAIARARQVAAPSPRLAEARALEATWREALGDYAGATLAYARLRESLELASVADARTAAEWLRTAARFERDVQKDVVAAERHLAVALKLAPRDRAVAEAYREVAALVAARAKDLREAGADVTGRDPRTVSGGSVELPPSGAARKA